MIDREGSVFVSRTSQMRVQFRSQSEAWGDSESNSTSTAPETSGGYAIFAGATGEGKQGRLGTFLDRC